jgi:hypothetical protein
LAEPDAQCHARPQRAIAAAMAGDKEGALREMAVAVIDCDVFVKGKLVEDKKTEPTKQ